LFCTSFCHFAALIPVAEAEEPSTQRQYGLKYDEDVHSFLTEAVTSKKVHLLALVELNLLLTQTNHTFCMDHH